MHVAAAIVLGLVISLYIAAFVVAVVEILHAPMGYEDRDGFHELTRPDDDESRRHPNPPHISRHLPLGGLS